MASAGEPPVSLNREDLGENLGSHPLFRESAGGNLNLVQERVLAYSLIGKTFVAQIANHGVELLSRVDDGA